MIMSRRQAAKTAATLALGFILGGLTWQPSWAQRKADQVPKAEQKTVGRYQIAVSGSADGRASVWAMDTATGQVWLQRSGTWEELARPIQVPEK
jgi:hypothetical protein